LKLEKRNFFTSGRRKVSLSVREEKKFICEKKIFVKKEEEEKKIKRKQKKWYKLIYKAKN
jgi:uncharacterized protein YgiM (DUF1202 family)